MTTTSSENNRIPSYEGGLAAYHEAFAPEIARIVSELPIPRDAVVLDVACGDGFHLPIFAQSPRVFRVVGIDINEPLCELAKAKVKQYPQASVQLGDALQLPFADQSIDFIWCAQSFYSLPDPIAALQEMKRVAKPGGMIGILENDTLHHVLLPWPVDLEIALRSAELEAFGAESDEPKKFYVARALPRIFRRCGLQTRFVRTYAHTRLAPFNRPERQFLEWYLTNLQKRVSPFLSSDFLARLQLFADFSDPNCFLEREDSLVTCLDHVVVGTAE